jgi:hypothetical protein
MQMRMDETKVYRCRRRRRRRRRRKSKSKSRIVHWSRTPLMSVLRG